MLDGYENIMFTPPMSSDIGDDIFCLSLATGVVELLIGISTPKKLQPNKQ